MILIAAAFLLAASVTAWAAQPEAVIDTAKPISPSQCAPCHVDLGSVKEPGIIFNHGNHLLVSCDACHARMPHRSGETEKVPMETCFACHGIQHGPQGELASAKCEDCHTKDFVLRPVSHVQDWKATPHADAANAGGVNRCMMCHSAPKDCDECHTKEGLDIGPMPDVYHPMVQPRDKGPSIQIYPDRPVSMSQCSYCHADLDKVDASRLIFNHGAHLARNYRCEACHEKFAHTETGTIKPTMLSCYRCHGTYHNGQGKIAEGVDCLLCHPKTFELMPPDHTMPFIKGTHGKRAGKDPAYCAMCHQSTFCVGCHRGEKTSPNAPGKPVIPANHRKPQWRSKHGGIFLDGKGACGSCHTDASCKRCHKTVMPHPVGWIKNHHPEPGITIEDCYVCHIDRNKCQNCHHKAVRQAELIASNCTPCHAEMKQKPATGIKHKGYAEHAVHFDVAKKKGKPYRCFECHVDFGTSQAARQVELQQGHDLRLCYQCHGALDPFNKLIAPYKGAALCRRCHSDLGV
ncbi:MAG TPA: cytochrome c3 family protein [Coriobacteriia bacterium]|nr:cytochrome c3 family protein [Coriobacteriia bacterium]